MFKKIVSEKEFLELCNQELRQHPDFEEGMEITGLPRNATASDLGGYELQGPDAIEEILPAVIKKVCKRYGFHIRPR